MSTPPATLLAFFGYLAVVVLIGLYAARFSSRGVGEFFLAGRSLGRTVVALSAVVSGRSGWLLLGFSGMAYVHGLSALWAAVGYVIVEFFLFWGYAGRLRRFSERHECLTLPDFFAARFGDPRGTLRLLLVGVMFVFLATYVSAQFIAGGKAFASSFNVSRVQGLWITAGIVLAYTMVGGFLAVSLTDLLQALFMILALVVLPVVAISELGGVSELAQGLRLQDPALLDPWSHGGRGWAAAGAIVGLIGIGLGSPGNPHILVRYMAIRDPAQLRVSAFIGTLWNSVMAVGALAIGLAGRVYFPDATTLLGGDEENVYPVLAQRHLSPFLFGVVLASIFAAIMSTADSQLLVAASGVVRDVYQKTLRRDRPVDDRRLVLLSRGTVLVLVALAVLLALLAQGVVFWFVLFAWAGLGAALGPTSILALYWKGTTRAGVLAGIVVGVLTVVVWRLTLHDWLYELVPAFLLSLFATILGSRATRPPADADALMASMRDDAKEPR